MCPRVAVAARNMGIRHTVSKDIQVEPQGEGTDDMDTKSIYHYTFGLTPKPPYPGAPVWHLDKRQYYGAYPSDHLSMPPSCTARSGFIIASMWNEAAQNIKGWPSRFWAAPDANANASPDNMRTRLLSSTRVEAETGLGALLRGTGPWQWGNIPKLFLYSRGIVYVPGEVAFHKGPIGTWAVSEPNAVRLRLCGKSYTLRFPKEGPWSFTAVDDAGGVTTATLADARQHTEELLAGVPAEQLRPHVGDTSAAPLVSEIAGSGPWFWAGSGPFSFMRGGVLITPWGTGTWGIKREIDESAPADTVFADFANSRHNVRMHVPECLRMQSTRKADNEKVGIDFAGNSPDKAAEGSCNAAP